MNHFMNFLSCLCGSQQESDTGTVPEIFLSCLCGSQHEVPSGNPEGSFLSCLCGSQQRSARLSGSVYFLSCLCGSQHEHEQNDRKVNFLSCLCGSQRLVFLLRLSRLFSKLPMRQSTAEESERASAPSRENPSPSILPKVSTGRKKSR